MGRIQLVVVPSLVLSTIAVATIAVAIHAQVERRAHRFGQMDRALHLAAESPGDAIVAPSGGRAGDVRERLLPLVPSKWGRMTPAR
jgi:hypothetical protein